MTTLTGVEGLARLMAMTPNDVMDTAYSGFEFDPINTVEHYLFAAHMDFPTLKADVQMTGDGVPVTCHDPGFTVREGGEIGPFKQDAHTRIRDMTLAEVKALMHPFCPELGYKPRIATVEEFLWVCKVTGKMPYLTLRETYPEETVRECLRLLRKYGLEDRCVINSFTRETLEEVRRQGHPNILLSQVLDLREPIPADLPERVSELGPAMITAFFFPCSRERSEELLEASRPAIAAAKALQVPLHMAQIRDPADREWSLEKGFNGFHVLYMRPVRTPQTVTFALGYDGMTCTVSGAYAGTASAEEGKLTLTSLRRADSPLTVDDVLPALWFARLPYTVTAESKKGQTVSAAVEAGHLTLRGFDPAKADTFTVTVKI